MVCAVRLHLWLHRQRDQRDRVDQKVDGVVHQRHPHGPRYHGPPRHGERKQWCLCCSHGPPRHGEWKQWC